MAVKLADVVEFFVEKAGKKMENVVDVAASGQEVGTWYVLFKDETYLVVKIVAGMGEDKPMTKQ